MNQLFGSLAILSILCSVAAAAVPPCETMVQELTPCQPYLTDTAASPTDDCCNGAKNIATYIVTQKDRTDVCECLKPTAVARADDPFRISALPGVCGVQIPLPPVTADTDCSTKVHSTALRTFEPLDHASDGSDLILATNDQEPFIAEMRSEPSNLRSDDSEVHSTVLRTPLHSTIPQFQNNLKLMQIPDNVYYFGCRV